MTAAFVEFHHAQMSTFVIEVCLWYIGIVTESTTKIDIKYRLWFNVSVPYPKPGRAENTVFSSRPSLEYGTLLQCTALRLLLELRAVHH